MLRKIIAPFSIHLLATPLAWGQVVGDGLNGGFSGKASGGPVAFTTPVIATVSLTAPATGTIVNYNGLVGNTANSWNSTLAGRVWPMPVAGKFSGLEVNVPSISVWSSGSIQMTMNIGGSTTGAPSCTLNAAPAVCSDHSTVSGDVSAGTLVAFESNPSTPVYTNTTPAPWQVSVGFKGDTAQQGLIFFGSIANASAIALNYAGTNGWNATESAVSVVMPTAGTIGPFYAYVSASMGAGAGYQYTVMHNGVATSLVAGNGSSTCWNTTLQCNDTTAGHFFTVAAGDTISVQSCPSNTATCPAGSAPTTRAASFGLGWVPITASQAVVFSESNAVPPTNSSSTRYSLVSGTTTSWDAAVTNQVSLLPYTTLTQTYGNWTVAYCGSASASAARAVSLDNAGTGLGPTINTGAVVACPSAGTGFSTGAGDLVQDTSHTYAATGPTTDTTTFDLKHVVTTGPAAVTQFKASMTAVVQ